MVSRLSARRAIGILLGLILAAERPGFSAGRAPIPVSPASGSRIAEVTTTCPTFSWSGVPGATAYELIVYDAGPGSNALPPGLVRPILDVELAGPALSWTPALEDGLPGGGTYAWAVRAVLGRGLGPWSEPRIFRVAPAPSGAVSVEPNEARGDDREAGRGPHASTLPAAGGASGDAAPNHHGVAPRQASRAAETGSAALRAEQPETSGESHGVHGLSHSPDGAALVGENTAGGADLLLAGSPAASVSEGGIRFESDSEVTFRLENTGPGGISLEVGGSPVLTRTGLEGQTCLEGKCVSGFDASGALLCRECLPPTCGDGRLEAGEECDDGNNAPGDGCRGNCRVERCGDGILDPGEGCDDGNNVAGDGCRGDCSEEICGDGVLDPGEQCDDGNQASGDGCSAGCSLEPTVLTAIVPDEAALGARGVGVSVVGTGIEGGSSLTIERAPIGSIEATGETVAPSGRSLSAVLEMPVAGRGVGPWDVHVTDAGGGSTETLAGGFAVTEPAHRRTFGVAATNFIMGVGAHSPGGIVYVVDRREVTVYDLIGRKIRSFGSGVLRFPNNCDADAAGDVYVVDETPALRKYDREGNLLWQTTGGTAGGFVFALWGVDAASDGLVYVAENNVSPGRVSVFRQSDGGAVSHFDAGGVLSAPLGVVLDPAAESIYIADTSANRIVKVSAATKQVERTFGTGLLERPFDLVVAPDGTLYVTDGNPFFVTGHHRVAAFDPEGNLLFTFGQQGAGAGQFAVPQGIDVADHLTIYVADSKNNRVQIWGREPEPPVFEPSPDYTVEAGTLLEFAVTAIDLAGDSVIYAAANLPAGAAFDQQTGGFSWLPTAGQAGVYPLEFRAFDTEGYSADQVVTVTVTVP